MRLYSNDPLVRISHSGNRPYVSPGAEGAGMVRWNTRSNQLEIWDGLTWQSLWGDAEIQLDPRIGRMLEWAEKKMQEDEKIHDMVSKNPAVSDAYRAYQDAGDRLRVVMALVEQEKLEK